jgi:hypothetical protein
MQDYTYFAGFTATVWALQMHCVCNHVGGQQHTGIEYTTSTAAPVVGQP